MKVKRRSKIAKFARNYPESHRRRCGTAVLPKYARQAAPWRYGNFETVNRRKCLNYLVWLIPGGLDRNDRRKIRILGFLSVSASRVSNGEYPSRASAMHAQFSQALETVRSRGACNDKSSPCKDLLVRKLRQCVEGARLRQQALRIPLRVGLALRILSFSAPNQCA